MDFLSEFTENNSLQQNPQTWPSPSNEQTIHFQPSKSKLINERKGSYIYDTKISLPESHKLEFKNYTWPFTQDLDFTLLRTICGFLNRSGGTILIGVNDEKIIKGIKISNIDQLKLHFDNLKKRFFPQPFGLIKTVEIPIKKYIGEDQEKYTWLPNTYVVRIEVNQGYLDKLYTFKFQSNQQQEILYSSFREDASLITLETFEQIYEKIYQKAICPESKAKAIIYDEPDQQGLYECQNFQQPEEHKIKHNFLTFTNIVRNKIQDFKKYLEDNLKYLKFEDFEIVVISEFITIIKSQRIDKIKDAINDITRSCQQVSTFTFKKESLQYGYLNNIITIKGIQKNDFEFISLIQKLNFGHRFKENGDLVISTSKNMKIVPDFYSFCKQKKLQIFIKFD